MPILTFPPPPNFNHLFPAKLRLNLNRIQLKAMITMTTKLFAQIATLFLTCAILFSGCVPHEPAKDDFFDKWKTKAKSSPPYTPTQLSLSESITSPEGEKSPAIPATVPTDKTDETLLDLPTTPLTVRFIDDDLATSLRTLARIGLQNILISPSVEGKLNLQTQETPWNKVFMGIINSYNLTVVKEANLLHVMSMADLKQQVERKTLHLQEQQVSNLVTKIVPVEFSDPKTIAETVNLLLSKDKDGKPRGSASIDQHSRSLILSETEANMNKLLILIHELDKPTAQILIEAHIVETTKDTARELGIQWGAMSARGVLGDSQVNLNPGTSAATYVPGTAAVAGTSSIIGSSSAPAVPGTSGTPLIPSVVGSLGVAATPAVPGHLIYPAANATTIGQNVSLGASSIKGILPATIGLIVNGNDMLLNAQLSALQRDGKLNILSSPSIATLDNSQAIIESGKSVPVQTVDSNGNPSTSYKDATLNLTVTPHVISDRMIKLNIEAKKDEVDTANAVLGNPYIIKKLAKTQLIVENNTTVVLAGLSKETHSGSNTGVPGLKDVPGFGWLFKKDSTSNEFEELLIFITPKILTKPIDPITLGDQP
ncbi:MAG: hypothetical protein KKD63_13295 [Proteobacteria bacterium]|nr:hypothetical protein [Pseudomonadota bacterium]